MTQTTLSFVIDRERSVVRLSGIPAALTTNSLGANIDFVQYDDVKGRGSILYNDRPPLPETFVDPSPYQSYVNQWITALAARPANPLTLAQAQAVKVAFVNAIGSYRRQLPVSVSVSGTSHLWDASDSAMAPLAGLSYVAPMNTLIGEVNSTFQALIEQVNSNFQGLMTELNNLPSISLATDAALGEGQFPADIAAWFPLAAVPDIPLPTPIPTLPSPTLSLVPVGEGSSVALSVNDLSNILGAIATQSVTVKTTIGVKTASINALSSVSAVVAYDATTGW